MNWRLNVLSAEHRQLDFWIGAWEVTIGGKKKVGSSKIESIVGSRVILENYSESKGFHGKSINFYDPVLGKWRENKVDGL